MKKTIDMSSVSMGTAICPHCGEEKQVIEYGSRLDIQGKIKPQSWCKVCRNSFEKNKDFV